MARTTIRVKLDQLAESEWRSDPPALSLSGARTLHARLGFSVSMHALVLSPKPAALGPERFSNVASMHLLINDPREDFVRQQSSSIEELARPNSIDADSRPRH